MSVRYDVPWIVQRERAYGTSKRDGLSGFDYLRVPLGRNHRVAVQISA